MIYKRGGRWWIQYWRDGQRFRESVQKATGQNTQKAARELERKRLGEIENGIFVGPQGRRLRLSDLKALLDEDYRNRQNRSGDRVDQAWNHVTRFFTGDPKAITITTAKIRTYLTMRREDDGAALATIGNELAALRRAFNVAVEVGDYPKGNVPTFPTIKPKNAKDEFYSEAEIHAVRQHLPDKLKNLWDIACWTGWRKQELLQLRWSQVDFDRGVVRLDMYETKNDEAREVPFDICRDLVRAFNEQRDYTRRVERDTGKIIPYVFHHFGGKPIKHIDGARRKACRAAGAMGKDGKPKVLHSTRRTAARRLDRAGVSRDIAMDIMGLKSESVFRRYNIRQNEDKRRGLEKVQTMLDFEAAKKKRSG